MSGDELLFVSLMADNMLPFCRDLSRYLSARLGVVVRVMEDSPWQVCEQRLYRGEAHLGVVCGLQYVLAGDASMRPGVEPLAAPVMRLARYGGRPVYFSDVVVRRSSDASSLGDLRGATWAYNEPTSHSGYGVARYALAVRGERSSGFFGQVVASGSHLESLSLLLVGGVDATAIDSTVLEHELRLRPSLAEEIRVVETLGPSPIPPLVVSRALPLSVREALSAAVLEMHQDALGSSMLAAAAISRFVAVVDADYDPIRMMAQVGAEVEPWIAQTRGVSATQPAAL